MDEAVFLLRLRVEDLALVYSLARRERMSVNEWIIRAIVEKIERVQAEVLQQQARQAEQSREGGKQ